MGSTDNFKKQIALFIADKAHTDNLFAPKFENPAKNIDDCVTYILNTVRKSGFEGFTDDEIYGMAIHYYDEESIEIGKPINARVVVNHRVEKTKKGENGDEEENQEQRRGTMATVKTLKKKEVKKEIPGVTRQSLFDYESED